MLMNTAGNYAGIATFTCIPVGDVAAYPTVPICVPAPGANRAREAGSCVACTPCTPCTLLTLPLIAAAAAPLHAGCTVPSLPAGMTAAVGQAALAAGASVAHGAAVTFGCNSSFAVQTKVRTCTFGAFFGDDLPTCATCACGDAPLAPGNGVTPTLTYPLTRSVGSNLTATW